MNSPGIHPGEERQEKHEAPPFDNGSQCGSVSQGGVGEGDVMV